MKVDYKVVFDYSKLKGRIKEVYDTQENFIKALGIGRSTLSQRLNNQSQFSQKEILKTCELLSIDKSKINDYFFTIKVQKGELNKAS